MNYNLSSSHTKGPFSLSESERENQKYDRRYNTVSANHEKMFAFRLAKAQCKVTLNINFKSYFPFFFGKMSSNLKNKY